MTEERMDEATARMVQREGAAALLDRGVSVPLKDIRIPFRKKPLKLRVVMPPCWTGACPSP